MNADRTYYDMPFIYVYDASTLVNGTNVNNISIPTLGDSEFLLRRVAGRNLVAGQIMLKDPIYRNLFQANSAILADWPVVPEILFPPNSFIYFDLQNVALVSKVNGAPPAVDTFISQLLFQGVRRFYDSQGPKTSYRFYDKPFSYSTTINVTWTNRIAPAFIVEDVAREFSIEIRDADFELHCIRIARQRFGGAWVPANQDIRLYLQNTAQKGMMTQAVPDYMLSENSNSFNGTFPIPPVLYPAGSYIRFAVESLLTAAEAPTQVTIDFQGMWRRPC